MEEDKKDYRREIAEMSARQNKVDLDAFVKKCMEMGIEEQRVFELICSYYGDFDEVRRVVSTYGAEPLNKGYLVIADRDHRLKSVSFFAPARKIHTNADAARQAEKDGIKLIPVSELPEDAFFFFFIDRRLVDTPENREVLRKFFEKHSLAKRRERKFKWIIGICSSDGNDVTVLRVDGTVPQVREYLYQFANKKREEDYDWDFGTESPNDVMIVSRDESWYPTKMYACACFSDFNIDYTATQLSSLTTIDLSEGKEVAV